LNKNVYILNMASRKVPTLFYDSRTLKVSFDKEKQTFYISAGLIIVGGKYFFFEGKEGDLLRQPCLIGIKVKGKFSKKEKIDLKKCKKEGEDEDECKEKEVTFLVDPKKSINVDVFCEPLVSGSEPSGGYYLKPIAMFENDFFIQFTFGPLVFSPRLVSDETRKKDKCSTQLFEFLL
jgi:hypothetical protein